MDYEYAWRLNSYGRPLRVQIAVDTGMHRLGEGWDCIQRIRQIFFLKNLEIEGIFTHLCAADGRSRRQRAFTKMQAERFWQTVKALEKEGMECGQAHLLSSYGALSYPEFGGTFARCGIALYGVLSSRADERRMNTGLLPVLSLYARVVSLRTLEKGECAGYGLAFRARRKTRLAVLSIGYADGVPRSLSCGKGWVLINGRKAPVAGRICMDQMLVDVTGISQVKAGDTAVLIGRDGRESIGVYHMAERAGTISRICMDQMLVDVTGISQVKAGDTAVLIGRDGRESIGVYHMAERAGTISNEILSRLGSRLERVVDSCGDTAINNCHKGMAEAGFWRD